MPRAEAGSRLGYIGLGAAMRRISRSVRAADQQPSEQHGLRDYRLWLTKSPRVQFRYFQRKKLRHVLINPTELATYDEHLDYFRRLVIEAGGEKVATDSTTLAELWEIEH